MTFSGDVLDEGMSHFLGGAKDIVEFIIAVQNVVQLKTSSGMFSVCSGGCLGIRNRRALLCLSPTHKSHFH